MQRYKRSVIPALCMRKKYHRARVAKLHSKTRSFHIDKLQSPIHSQERNSCSKSISMLSIRLVSPDFLLLCVPCSVDINSIPHIKPMHDLSVLISKMLKDYTNILLLDEVKASYPMESNSGFPTKFRTIEKVNFKTLIKVLKEAKKLSPGFGLQIDFSKP